MYKHEQSQKEYHDQQRSMRASGLIQAIWQSGLAPKMTDATTIEWIENMFDKSVAIIEAYVKKEPYIAPETSDPFISTGNTHLSDEKVAESLPPTKPWQDPVGIKLADTVTGIVAITEKEYKPKKFRYGFKDSKGTWYSSFFKQHFFNAQEAKNAGKQVRILYQIGEYNGKAQFTVQSLDVM